MRNATGIEGPATAELKWLPVSTLTALRTTGPHGVRAAGKELVLIRVGDAVHAYDGRCPHQGTLLAEGELEDGSLVCRAHRWCFDVATGSRRNGPECLRGYQVRIEADQVLVGFPVGVSKIASAPAALRTPAQLPGPRGLPLIGNLLQIRRSAFHQTLEEGVQRWGPLYRFRLGRQPMVVVADAELANAVLKARPEEFRRSSQLERVSVLGVSLHGVFMAEGERWRRQRPVVVQSLDTRHLRQFFPTLLKVLARLERRWQAAGAEPGGRDVQADLMRFTVDVTASLAFGQDINTLEEQGEVLQQHLDKIFPSIQRRLLSPFPYWRWLSLPVDRDLAQSVRRIYATIAGFVAAARERLEDHPELCEAPENLLQSLLVAAAADPQFDEREIADNVLTMLLAGEDTTANTLAWALYFLAGHPGVQERLAAEVAVALPEGRLTDFDQLRELPWIDAVIQETMRLKPVAPLNIVEANHDLDIGPLRLRKGDGVAILTRAIALAEPAFSAAECFDPERWLRASADRRGFNPHSFMPFGSGPRLCPGRSLALLEMKAVLALVAARVRVEPACNLARVRERLAFTMSPQGLRLRLHPRV